MIHFGPEICHSLEAALQREWLETHQILAVSLPYSMLSQTTARRRNAAAAGSPVGRLTPIAA
jgi:hypothetical protein